MTENVHPPIEYTPLIHPGPMDACRWWTDFMWPGGRGGIWIVSGIFLLIWVVWITLKLWLWLAVLAVLLVIAGIAALTDIITFRWRLRRMNEREALL